MRSYLYFAFPLFSLWDFYFFQYGRIFDYLGLIAIIIYYLLTVKKMPTIVPRVSQFMMVNSIIFLPCAIIGIYNEQLITVAAFLVGAYLVFPFFCAGMRKIDYNKFIKWYNSILVVHLFFFFLQFFSYYLFNYVIDYHAYSGLIGARTFNEELLFFRASGLFQEPNSYCVTIYLLLFIRALFSKKPFDLIALISLTSIFLSESLWGYGALLVYCSLFSSTAKSRIIMLMVFIVVGMAVLLIPDLVGLIISPTTVIRLSDVSGDPSAEGRYMAGQERGYLSDFVVGHGISTYGFQWIFGANALGFYVSSFGIIGLILWFLSLYNLVPSSKITFLIGVIFAMTTYPLFTYMFWWAWIGMATGIDRAKLESNV